MDPEIWSSHNKTALCMASYCGYTDIMQLLINHAVDLNIKSHKWLIFYLQVE
jgi:ankyrin repeat protein